MRRPRVLVIDDSEIASAVACAVLNNDGFDVRAVRGADELGDVLEVWSPDIVLADVNMPGVSGPDLCRWIKVRVETQSVPVVLYSDMSEARLQALAEDAGADAYVTKANGIEHVSAKLTRLCEEIVW
jgi:CheY-like chemotaxis protein